MKVQFCCLRPSDLERGNEHSPGGGLVGIVEECGSAATSFASSRVLVPVVQACGECETCRSGFASVCPHRSLLGQDRDGGCASSVVADSRWLIQLENGLEGLTGPEAAFVAGPGLLAYGMFARAGTGAGDLVLVIGKGPVASTLCHLAEGRGAKVVCLGEQEELAGLAATLEEMDAGARPQQIFACEGNHTIASALAVASPGSRITTCVSTGTIPLDKLLEREISVLAVPFGHADLLTEVAALVAKSEVLLSEFIREEELGPQSIASAQSALAAGTCLVVKHGL